MNWNYNFIKSRGHGSFEPSYTFNSKTTSSENRWMYVNDIINSHEEFQKGDGSNQWTYEAFKAADTFTKRENASKVKIPVMLFQAGKDEYVKEGGQNKFAKYAENCELVKLDDSMHSIFTERDEIQKPYIEKLIEFYDK